jgi:vacuolar-type H+-ATPase subunit F/Vma7|uniref:V-type ATP synthase subunit F n=1 Tax=candidate division WOR-3 bacterium TaxID=2052148 RepID=A0A7V3VUI3_UNCW3
MSGDLAIIGKRQEILPFLATGALTFVIEKGEAEKKVTELINEGVKIIFFSEDFMEELMDILKRYQTETFPCLIPFSTGAKKTNIAIERLRGIIKKAVGAEIFLEEK